MCSWQTHLSYHLWHQFNGIIQQYNAIKNTCSKDGKLIKYEGQIVKKQKNMNVLTEVYGLCILCIFLYIPW